MRKRWLWLLVLAGGALALVLAVIARVKKVAQQQKLIDLAAASASAAPVVRPAGPADLAEVVYDGRLMAGWQDLGGGGHDLGAGAARVRFSGFGSIIFQHAVMPWSYGGVVFRYQAPEGWGSFLTVALQPDPGTGGPTAAGGLQAVKLDERHLVTQGEGWQEAFVGYDELNPDGRSIVGLVISANRAVGSDWVSLDKVALTKPPAGFVKATPVIGKALRVRCDARSRPIDPRIYGAANDEWSNGQTAIRLGGNVYTRMNFELGAWNTGSDWFFENVGADGARPLFGQIDAWAKKRQSIALVVPTIGFVAKDAQSVGFPRAKFPPQRKYDAPKNAGDGYSAAGAPLKPGPPEQTSIPAPPELIGAWIRKLHEADVARGHRAVELYILDNEPSLWNETHRDVRPTPLGYDELLDRTVRYASAIKDADPEGLIAGPAEWGWTGYFYSAIDRDAGVSARPDRRAHGDLPLIPWYLQSLAAREKANGKRLLDVLDVHYYPMAPGVRDGNEDVSPAGAARRLRSTRALWDAGYRDESWIKESVELIPRLKRWVAEYYPGTKLAIGEWSFGAVNHISGGLATAEALGRFGSEGLDAAYHWGGLPAGSPTYWAFRAFRNFDGDGGRFLDVSLQTEETADVSIFASADEARKHLVLVLLNKNADSPIDATVDLSSCGAVTSSRMFSYAAGSKAFEKQEPKELAESRSGGVRAPLSPYSMTVLDLRVEAAR